MEHRANEELTNWVITKLECRANRISYKKVAYVELTCGYFLYIFLKYLIFS